MLYLDQHQPTCLSFFKCTPHLALSDHLLTLVYSKFVCTTVSFMELDLLPTMGRLCGILFRKKFDTPRNFLPSKSSWKRISSLHTLLTSSRWNKHKTVEWCLLCSDLLCYCYSVVHFGMLPFRKFLIFDFWLLLILLYIVIVWLPLFSVVLWCCFYLCPYCL